MSNNNTPPKGYAIVIPTREQELEYMLHRAISIIEMFNDSSSKRGTYYQFVEHAKQLLNK